MCLLHVMQELFPACVAGVAHFNHKWRAEASDEDERFVARLAHPYPFFRAEAQPAPGNREQNARRARLVFFASLGTTVALGHTRDDQAETVLFRFLRGSGLAGLAGIAPAASGIIRPLIDVTRKEVEEFLRARNIPWREDATNADPAFARNRIRHQLLPQLAREWNPKIAEALARMADLAREEEHYWQREMAKIELIQMPASVDFPVSILSSMPRAAARRLIRRAIYLAKGDLRQIEFDHVEAVLKLRRRIRLPGVTVTRSFDWIRFASAEPELSAPLQIGRPGKYPSPDGQTRICLDIAPSGAPDACANLNTEACNFCPPLELRGWRPGDCYRPQGQTRDRKIQEMFQKARVPSWRRASWPIVTRGERILWARQFGLAEDVAGTVLRIREVSLS